MCNHWHQLSIHQWISAFSYCKSTSLVRLSIKSLNSLKSKCTIILLLEIQAIPLALDERKVLVAFWLDLDMSHMVPPMPWDFDWVGAAVCKGYVDNVAHGILAVSGRVVNLCVGNVRIYRSTYSLTGASCSYLTHRSVILRVLTSAYSKSIYVEIQGIRTVNRTVNSCVRYTYIYQPRISIDWPPETVK